MVWYFYGNHDAFFWICYLFIQFKRAAFIWKCLNYECLYCYLSESINMFKKEKACEHKCILYKSNDAPMEAAGSLGWLRDCINTQETAMLYLVVASSDNTTQMSTYDFLFHPLTVFQNEILQAHSRDQVKSTAVRHRGRSANVTEAFTFKFNT